MAAIPVKIVVGELKDRNRLGCSHLVDLYQARLINEAVRVFHVPAEDADEIVSDVLLLVVKNIHSFEFKRGDADFNSWVITIFRNKIRDFVRKEASTGDLLERFEEADLEVEKQYSKVEREATESIVRAYQDEVRRTEGESDTPVAAKLLAIADALDRLESWERVLLRCRALDVPYEDIARYTEKPVPQLKVYHARVKKKFVKLLAEYYPELNENESRSG